MQRYKFKSNLAFLALLIIQPLAQAIAQSSIERVNVSSTGEQANNVSYDYAPSINADGRFVVFLSNASNLVPGDTNHDTDIFIHDRDTGKTKRVSVSSTGEQGNNDALYHSISADGRFVAFYSHASNMVPGDTNNDADVFVHDLNTEMTKRVSVSTTGQQGNDRSLFLSISANGRFVAFESDASNLVPGDTNDTRDIFVHDRDAHLTERISISSSGEQGNSGSAYTSISADGRYVVFESAASNLVPGDTNGESDIFVRDRKTGVTVRLSVSSSGEQGSFGSYDPSISANGRFIAFDSFASNLVPGDTNDNTDTFVHDRETGETVRVSISSSGAQGNSVSFDTSISANGRFVTFHSYAQNLVPGDTNNDADIFVHDRNSGMTELISVSSTGQQGNGESLYPSISADGRFVVFRSDANILVPDDINSYGDIFVTENSLFRFGNELSVIVKPTSVTTLVDQRVRLRALLHNISNQTLTNCRITPTTRHYYNGQRQYGFFTWTTASSGTNQGIDITPGERATVYMVITPKAAFEQEFTLDYTCDQLQAYRLPFANTPLVRAKTQPLIAEDFIKLDNDNRKTELVIDRNSSDHWSTYVVSVKNTGTDTTSVSLSTSTPISKKLLRPLKLCETVSADNYQCLNPLTEQIQVTLAGDESTKVIVFAHANRAITQTSVTNRIFLEGRDQTGELVAKNSIGVYTID